MAHRRKEHEDDDGRTIVDMSGVSNPSLLGRRPAERMKFVADEPKGNHPQPEQPPFTREERWMYALGALKAALLIALAFIVGLGLVIAILLLIWHIL